MLLIDWEAKYDQTPPPAPPYETLSYDEYGLFLGLWFLSRSIFFSIADPGQKS